MCRKRDVKYIRFCTSGFNEKDVPVRNLGEATGYYTTGRTCANHDKVVLW
jgi:hypothetical protein